MKTIKVFLTALVITISLSSCSKDDDGMPPVQADPQYPMKTLLENGIMDLKNTKVNWVNTYELGYEFKAFKNGKITALGVRIPDNGEFRVTLWNSDTEEILVTQNITSTSGLMSFEDIAHVQITSGTRYFIAVNTNSYYQFNDSGNIVFPAESDDIMVLAYKGSLGNAQVLPPNDIKTAYAGIVDIKFVPNN
ncbi:DUF4082 domain-containing protein [Hyunsoonleella sp. SJ7]|uniref:DUF4082 domain-containing protein n=1 Tax=Hyunsoonleella aquatilis TaxID=2762758 RepID=A0A923HCL5_9FLAO|nr:DUF4082 domain-containing protein [Hyunsoonleella aquatilis]MBC3758954.1 DUF4082 domain-containing protein [Hyunsoonleella aquatilis]